MRQTVRFLYRFSWPSWLIMAFFAAVILLGAVLTGVPRGTDNIFATYFVMYPMLIPMLTMILSFSLCSCFLNVALSFGARRRDFFLSLQGVLLLDVLIGCALAWLMACLPQTLGWAGSNEIFSVQAFLEWAGGLYALMIFGEAALGCAVGLLLGRSRILGTVLVVLASLLSAGLFLVLTLSGILNLPPWLRPAAAAVSAGMAVGSEAFLWRSIRRQVVR